MINGRRAESTCRLLIEEGADVNWKPGVREENRLWIKGGDNPYV